MLHYFFTFEIPRVNLSWRHLCCLRPVSALFASYTQLPSWLMRASASSRHCDGFCFSVITLSSFSSLVPGVHCYNLIFHCCFFIALSCFLTFSLWPSVFLLTLSVQGRSHFWFNFSIYNFSLFWLKVSLSAAGSQKGQQISSLYSAVKLDFYVQMKYFFILLVKILKVGHAPCFGGSHHNKNVLMSLSPWVKQNLFIFCPRLRKLKEPPQ